MSKSNTTQAFWVSAGNFIALLFTIGATMVMSRLYSTIDYGTYRQIFWVYSSLTVVFTLGLPRAFGYFLPKVPINQGQQLTDKITKLFFVLGGLFSLILFLFSNLIAEALNNPDLSLGLKLFSPVPFFLIPTMGIDSIYATYKKTEVSAVYHIVSKAVLASFLILSAVLYKTSYIYAVIAFDIASFVSFVYALYLKRYPFKRIKADKTCVTYKEILMFSLPLMGANILNIIINSTDQFFISRFFGVEEFAKFSNGAMELPFISMIVGACSVVLLPVYSKIKNNGDTLSCKSEILNLWKSVFIKCIKLIYPIIIFCMVYAQDIMVLLYGEKYSQSGKFFLIMLINNFFAIISTYPLILALNKVKQYMGLYAINAIILIVLECIVVYFVKDIYWVCIVSVFSLALRNISFIWLIARELRESVLNLIPFTNIIPIIVLSAMACLLSKYLGNYFELRLFINVILGFCASALIYFTICYFVGIDYLSIIRPLIPNRLKSKV